VDIVYRIESQVKLKKVNRFVFLKKITACLSLMKKANFHTVKECLASCLLLFFILPVRLGNFKTKIVMLC
jgi:hypothetical protein